MFECGYLHGINVRIFLGKLYVEEKEAKGVTSGT